MDYHARLDNIQKVNTILWMAILAGMLVLLLVSWVLDMAGTFTPNPVAREVSNILFYVAIALAFAVLFLKRIMLLPEKIAEKIAMLPENERIEKMAGLLRRNYILIWAMGETIFMIGFIGFVLSGNLKAIVIYAVVGFYAVLVTKPQRKLLSDILSATGIVN